MEVKMGKLDFRNLKEKWEGGRIFDYEKDITGQHTARVDKEGNVWDIETGEQTHQISSDGKMWSWGEECYTHQIRSDGKILHLRTGECNQKLEIEYPKTPVQAAPRPTPSGGGGGGTGGGSILPWPFSWLENPLIIVLTLLFMLGFSVYLFEEYLMPAIGSVLLRTKVEEKTYPTTKMIRDSTKAIKSDPNNIEKYFSRGKAYFWDSFDTDQRTGERYKYFWITNNIKIKWKAKNHLGDAISDFTKVIELSPGFAPAYFYRGWAYSRLGESELGQYYNAISDFTKAIELNPKYIEAYKERANAYLCLAQAGYDRIDNEANANRDAKKARELKSETESENRNKVAVK